jgi:citrate lyase subunit beta/citryl-CoA lyase
MRLAERSLRSLLFVPGDSERKQTRAIIAGADAVILDLEDSVANAQVPAARARVAAMLRSHSNGPHVQLWVRVNALSSGLLLQDLVTVLGDQASPAGIVLPKVNRAAEIEEVAYYLAALEAAYGLTIGVTRLLVITAETAEGLLTLSQFPTQFRAMPRAVTKRVVGLSWGLGGFGNFARHAGKIRRPRSFDLPISNGTFDMSSERSCARSSAN